MAALVIGVDHGVVEDQVIRYLSAHHSVPLFYEGLVDLSGLSPEVKAVVNGHRETLEHLRYFNGLEDPELLILIYALFTYVAISDPRLVGWICELRGRSCADETEGVDRQVVALARLFHTSLAVIYTYSHKYGTNNAWWDDYRARCDWTYRLKLAKYSDAIAESVIADAHASSEAIIKQISNHLGLDFEAVLGISRSIDQTTNLEAAKRAVSVVQNLRDTHSAGIITSQSETETIAVVGNGHVKNLRTLLEAQNIHVDALVQLYSESGSEYTTRVRAAIDRAGSYR